MAITRTPQDLITVTHWIGIAQVGATAFVGIVAGFITWKMQSKQIDIAKGLQEIARGQHETAATKLRLELFEKRYKAYENVVDALTLVIKFIGNKNSLSASEVITNYEAKIDSIRFLFDDSVYLYLKSSVSHRVDNFLIEHDANRRLNYSDDYFQKEQENKLSHIMEIYKFMAELNRKVAPFLKIA